MSEGKHKFILYDARACRGRGTDEAAVLESNDSETAARRAAAELGVESACYRYDFDIVKRQATNESWLWDYVP